MLQQMMGVELLKLNHGMLYQTLSQLQIGQTLNKTIYLTKDINLIQLQKN